MRGNHNFFKGFLKNKFENFSFLFLYIILYIYINYVLLKHVGWAKLNPRKGVLISARQIFFFWWPG